MCIRDRNRDDFLIRIEADTVLEFNTVPQDYKTLFEKTCIPIVSQRLFDMVDKMCIRDRLEVGGSSSSDKDDAIVVSPVEPVTPVTPINPGTGARA